MQSLLKIALVGVLIAAPTTLQAQDAEMRTRFMMLNQHQCSEANMDDVMEIVDNVLAPSLSALEEEGSIDDWGILRHAWGDEYNFNFFMVTEDHRAFLDAWSSLLEMSSDADPEWYDRFTPLCVAHKDNMYLLRDYAE